MLIGTSGFAYRHWARAFYPDGLPQAHRLEYYARRFRTVELNVTFYRLPAAEAFDSWRDQVPDDFVFAVKASRYLTHLLRLKDPEGPVEELMERVSRLRSKLGPVLLQLPPTMPARLDRLEATLVAFEAMAPGVRVAVEPRHRSWFSEELHGLLGRHGAALCLADRRGPQMPLWQTASWLYLRFHGGRALPSSCYGRVALRSWERRTVDLAGSDPDGCAYFNNDLHACAIGNALTFERLLSRSGPLS